MRIDTLRRRPGSSSQNEPLLSASSSLLLSTALHTRSRCCPIFDLPMHGTLCGAHAAIFGGARDSRRSVAPEQRRSMRRRMWPDKGERISATSNMPRLEGDLKASLSRLLSRALKSRQSQASCPPLARPSTRAHRAGSSRPPTRTTFAARAPSPPPTRAPPRPTRQTWRRGCR